MSSRKCTPPPAPHARDAEEADGDAAFIAKALGDIARAKGMAQVACDAGLSRESLYKALSGGCARRPVVDSRTLIGSGRSLGGGLRGAALGRRCRRAVGGTPGAGQRALDAGHAIAQRVQVAAHFAHVGAHRCHIGAQVPA